MSDHPTSNRDFSGEISTTSYNAERLDPRPGQPLYLHLSDLRLALAAAQTDAKIRLLDYGCGGSPYRSLFPNSDYKRADYLQVDRLDYLLNADSRVPEKDGVFDTILSTQVLEHIAQPEIYLSECYRLLKPNGQLILTTHGTFPEHGCPYDYQRWTADGLRIAIEKQGFHVSNQSKLTSGARAVFFLLDTSVHWLQAPRHGLFGFILWLARVFFYRTRPWLHHNCDRYFSASRQVALDSQPPNSFYIGLFVVARKV